MDLYKTRNIWTLCLTGLLAVGCGTDDLGDDAHLAQESNQLQADDRTGDEASPSRDSRDLLPSRGITRHRDGHSPPIRIRSELWVSPPSLYSGRVTSDENFVFTYPDKMRRFLELVDHFSLHTQGVDKMSESQLETALRVLRNAEVRVGLITAGLKSSACSQLQDACRTDRQDSSVLLTDPACTRYREQAGFVSAQHDFEQLDRISAAATSIGSQGVKILTLDGPLKRVLDCGENGGGGTCQNACQFTVPEAVEQAVAYAEGVRSRYGDIKIDWMVNFLNWDYTMPNGELMYGVKGPGRGTGDSFDARVLIQLVERHHERTPFGLRCISQEGGAEWYTGGKASTAWPAGARQDWMSRLLAFRAQVDATGIPFQHVFSSVDASLCDGVTAERMDACIVRRDAVAYGLLLDNIEHWKRANGEAGTHPLPEIISFTQWNAMPDQMLPEDQGNTFAKWVLTGTRLLYQ